MPEEPFVFVSAIFALLVAIAPLPGLIARRRGHPQSDAIAAAGWLSLLTAGITLPIALIWAYTKPRIQTERSEVQEEIDDIISQIHELRTRVDLIERFDAFEGSGQTEE